MDNLEEMDRYLEKLSSQDWTSKKQISWTTQLQKVKLKQWLKNLPKKQKPRARWFHRGILSNIQRRANVYFSETLPKNCRGRNTSKLILWGHNHPYTKTRKRQHKKRKLQTNITDEHRCKNPQQNSSKQNPTTH